MNLNVTWLRRFRIAQFFLPGISFLSMSAGGNGNLGEFGFFLLLIGVVLITFINIYVSSKLFYNKKEYSKHLLISIAFLGSCYVAYVIGVDLGGIYFLSSSSNSVSSSLFV